MSTPVIKDHSLYSWYQYRGIIRVLRQSFGSYWDMYVIILVAALLRFYGITTTQFDDDQAAIFGMAREAIVHGHLVATSNIASIGIYNPPAIVYLLMIPAAISANPLAGAIFTALLATVAVLLVYLCVRRYYGRFAAMVASSLYAVSALPVFYSRFMWNQNMLLFFVPLLICVLFLGCIERRKGWLPLAVVLVGLAIQLHATGVVLLAPLLVALCLSPRTLRLQDLVLSAAGLLMLYGFYILWLFNSHFLDIQVLTESQQKLAEIDGQSWAYFVQFLSPYDPNSLFNQPFQNTRSILYPALPWLAWLPYVMTGLAICAALMLLWMIFFPGYAAEEAARGIRERIWRWWRNLRASPTRCGLVVLLVWQLVPLIYLSRHSVALYAHYFIVLLPGTFIGIGIFLSRLRLWSWQRIGHGHNWLRRAVYVLTAVVIIGELCGGTALAYDMTAGTANVNYITYNALSSLQNALQEADQIAQQHHYHRIYIGVDARRTSAMNYLAQFMHTPVTIFKWDCLVLPAPESGPALLLTMPEDARLRELVLFSAQRKPVAMLERVGGRPFELLAVNTTPPHTEIEQPAFVSNLSLLNVRGYYFAREEQYLLRWRVLRNLPSLPRVNYSYRFAIRSLDGRELTYKVCNVNNIQAGDQLFMTLKQVGLEAQSAPVSVQFSQQTPYTMDYELPGGLPIVFDTYANVQKPWKTLFTTTGSSTILVRLPGF